MPIMKTLSVKLLEFETSYGDLRREIEINPSDMYYLKDLLLKEMEINGGEPGQSMKFDFNIRKH